MSHVFISRRTLLKGGLGLSLSAALPVSPSFAQTRDPNTELVAKPAQVALVGEQYPETVIWSYNEQVPGPEIRIRQGDRLTFTVTNRLGEVTTVHSHGIRLPHAMDGVPHVTQKPIAPGETFTYEFDVPDAGTYWYHPHTNSAEQIERGLAGPLIVEERVAIEVDRDVTWMLDDWRLSADASIAGGFGNAMDAGMAGRLGNTVTINGKVPETFDVRAGERIRLRLINTANARIFGLDFGTLRPRVIAYDGQPVAPHEPHSGLVILGPAMRIDIIIDMVGEPNQSVPIIDRFYPSQAYRLVNVVYLNKPQLRAVPLTSSIQLPANTMPEPDMENAERHVVEFGGGMMGGMSGGMMGGGMMGRMRNGGKMWTINGVAFEGPVMEPLVTLAQGRSHIMTLRNKTAWFHPIHLHGHSFRVIARNGKTTRYREWQDTVLISPRESVDIAFVADNPGDWMFHCHIAEHLASGMMGIVRVT